ncbi:MAG: RNA-binding protein [Clostridia bacterium]|jgi:large subunit ribosomal protein L14e|nr:RNA-binding protein [Clostridiales bacterium]
MEKGGIVLGQVVRSKAGRDKDAYFVVVGLEKEQYLYIADGNLRKVDRPKKKKAKHLARTGIVLTEVAEKLKSGKKVTNAELRKNLRDLGG